MVISGVIEPIRPQEPTAKRALRDSQRFLWRKKEFRDVVTNQRGGAEWFLGETREVEEEEIAFFLQHFPVCHLMPRRKCQKCLDMFMSCLCCVSGLWDIQFAVKKIIFLLSPLLISIFKCSSFGSSPPLCLNVLKTKTRHRF